MRKLCSVLLFQSFAANGTTEDGYDTGYDFGSMPKYGNQYGGIAESFTNMADVKPEMEHGKPRILLMGLRRYVCLLVLDIAKHFQYRCSTAKIPRINFHYSTAEVHFRRAL